MNVRFYSGATTEDTTEHLIPATRKKPDALNIHAYTNELTNNISTIKYARNITKITEEMNGGGDIQVGFSQIIERRDYDSSEKIKDILMKE